MMTSSVVSSVMVMSFGCAAKPRFLGKGWGRFDPAPELRLRFVVGDLAKERFAADLVVETVVSDFHGELLDVASAHLDCVEDRVCADKLCVGLWLLDIFAG